MSTLYLEKKNRFKLFFSQAWRHKFFWIQRYYYPKKTRVQDDPIEHAVYHTRTNRIVITNLRIVFVG